MRQQGRSLARLTLAYLLAASAATKPPAPTKQPLVSQQSHRSCHELPPSAPPPSPPSCLCGSGPAAPGACPPPRLRRNTTGATVPCPGSKLARQVRWHNGVPPPRGAAGIWWQLACGYVGERQLGEGCFPENSDGPVARQIPKEWGGPATFHTSGLGAKTARVGERTAEFSITGTLSEGTVRRVSRCRQMGATLFSLTGRVRGSRTLSGLDLVRDHRQGQGQASFSASFVPAEPGMHVVEIMLNWLMADDRYGEGCSGAPYNVSQIVLG